MAIQWLLDRLCAYPKGTSMLDFGCSIPVRMKQKGLLDNINYTAVHHDETIIKIASKNVPDAKFVKFPIEFFDPEEKFDIVLMMDVLELQMDPKPVLKSSARAVKKNGEIYVLFKNNPIDDGESIIKKVNGFYDNTYSSKWLIAEFGYSKVYLHERHIINMKEIWRLQRQ